VTRNVDIAWLAKGEPPELLPLTRYPVNVVFHGHVHGGSPEGRTRNDVPVFTVALPLLQRVYPDRPSIRTVELPS
jgi:hypothetical protein